MEELHFRPIRPCPRSPFTRAPVRFSLWSVTTIICFCCLKILGLASRSPFELAHDLLTVPIISFLALSYSPCGTFSDPALESALSPRSPGSFPRREPSFRTEMWVCAVVLMATRPRQDRLRHVCVCVYV